MAKRGRPKTKGGSKGPADISLDAVVELLARQARELGPGEAIPTRAWEELADLAGVSTRTLRNRVKATLAKPADEKPREPQMFILGGSSRDPWDQGWTPIDGRKRR